MKTVICLILSLCLLCTLSPAFADEEGTIRIGMLTDNGGINDQSFNQIAWENLLTLAEEDDTFEMDYLESVTDAYFQTNLQSLIDGDYDLIICVGYMLADATREAALNNPDQRFAIIDDASCQDLPNVACLMFAQEQAAYLVGLVAGSVTRSKTVGYITGKVSDVMNLFGIGYITGVLEACPEANVLQYNVDNFYDIDSGAEAARDMIANGADVIFHAAGSDGLGIIEACSENGIWAIGVDTDQSVLDPNYVITSAVKRVDVACQDICKDLKNGSFVAGIHLYDLSNGGVDLAPTRDHIPADVLEKVEAAKAAIIAGEITVPTTAEDCPAFILGQ